VDGQDYVQYCTLRIEEQLITSEKTGLFGWHKDRGGFVGNIETNPAFKLSCKK